MDSAASKIKAEREGINMLSEGFFYVQNAFLWEVFLLAYFKRKYK